MWDRKELKAKGKTLFKANYWKCVVATLVLAICTGAGIAIGTGGGTDAETTAEIQSAVAALDMDALLGLLGIFISAAIISSIIGAIVSVFVGAPFEVGARKLLVNCEYGTASYRDILSAFKNAYGNTVLTLFLRKLFIALWSLLFIIPGIVKSYEYQMVPYLLAENPQMGHKEAFAQSKAMMMGNKWKAFVLDWSFILWELLSAITFGILEVFYVGPYREMTKAQLYHTLKG